MSTLAPLPDPERNPRVKAVFDDIRATRKTDFINNLWQRLAFDPALLEATWAEVKQVMATPSAIDPLTKEMVYITASIINGCSYCVHSHTAAAKAKGMTTIQFRSGRWRRQRPRNEAETPDVVVTDVVELDAAITALSK